MRGLWFAACVAVAGPALAIEPPSGGGPKTDARFPFRVGWANEHLPWYRLKPDELPPFHSEYQTEGEVVAVDPVRRTGRFRETKTGGVVDFTLLPYGGVARYGAPADLRDLACGTHAIFFLYKDDIGSFTKAVFVADDSSMQRSHGRTYRLEGVEPGGGRITVTRQGLTRKAEDADRFELAFDDATRVWKGTGRGTVADLAVGQALTVNLTGVSPHSPGHCTDIWVDAESQNHAAEVQRAMHYGNLKERGLPARIDQVEGNSLTVTLFAEPDFGKEFRALVDGHFAVGTRTMVAVADELLRTYDPINDARAATVLETRTVTAQCYGNSGIRYVIEPQLMLEGFRKNRLVRLFPNKWPVKNMPPGERHQ